VRRDGTTLTGSLTLHFPDSLFSLQLNGPLRKGNLDARLLKPRQHTPVNLVPKGPLSPLLQWQHSPFLPTRDLENQKLDLSL
jgi:hypothetical protein